MQKKNAPGRAGLSDYGMICFLLLRDSGSGDSGGETHCLRLLVIVTPPASRRCSFLPIRRRGYTIQA